MMAYPAFRIAFCALAAAILASCASSSQGPKLSAADKSFLGGVGSYDKDKDNVVTCEEWRTAAASLFNRAGNGGDVLTEANYKQLALIDRTYAVTSFKYFDANSDGKIDRAEFVERPNPAFTYADKDKDCRLTDLELKTARNISATPAQTSPSRRGPVTSSPVQNAQRPGQPVLTHFAES